MFDITTQVLGEIIGQSFVSSKSISVFRLVSDGQQDLCQEDELLNTTEKRFQLVHRPLDNNEESQAANRIVSLSEVPRPGGHSLSLDGHPTTVNVEPFDGQNCAQGFNILFPHQAPSQPPPELLALSTLRDGLVLIIGPQESGKSTAAHSILDPRCSCITFDNHSTTEDDIVCVDFPPTTISSYSFIENSTAATILRSLRGFDQASTATRS